MTSHPIHCTTYSKTAKQLLRTGSAQETANYKNVTGTEAGQLRTPGGKNQNKNKKDPKNAEMKEEKRNRGEKEGKHKINCEYKKIECKTRDKTMEDNSVTKTLVGSRRLDAYLFSVTLPG